jgi:hypothetical protein
MGQDLYFRKWKLTVETWRGDSITIPADDITGEGIGDLRVTFRIEKNWSQIQQFGEIVIYNLNKNTETDIFKNGKIVTLEAGYRDGPFGIIFKGFIRQPIRGKEDATTYFLKLICLDGDDALNLGFASLVLAENQTAQTIINSIARSSTVPFDVRINGELPQQATTRGKSIFGMASDAIRSVAINNNAAFFVNNGQATVTPLSLAPNTTPVELNANTGMVGIPYQVDQGVQVRSLLNPRFQMGEWIRLNNASIILAELEIGQLQTLLDVDGIYRIIEMHYTGDTRGNDWYVDILGIGQAGALPTLLAGPNQNGI